MTILLEANKELAQYIVDQITTRLGIVLSNAKITDGIMTANYNDAEHTITLLMIGGNDDVENIHIIIKSSSIELIDNLNIADDEGSRLVRAAGQAYLSSKALFERCDNSNTLYDDIQDIHGKACSRLGELLAMSIYNNTGVNFQELSVESFETEPAKYGTIDVDVSITPTFDVDDKLTEYRISCDEVDELPDELVIEVIKDGAIYEAFEGMLIAKVAIHNFGNDIDHVAMYNL